MRYFKTYVLLVLFFTENGLARFSYEDLPKDCGKSKYNHEVFNGVSTALVGQFPWIVRVGLFDGNSKIFYCTGSLIHPSYVVTAAHCGEDCNVVRLGENILNRDKDCSSGVCAPPYQDISIRRHIFSNHCRITNTDDISLLALEKPAKISDFVRPICLPDSQLSLDVLKEERTITAGWGVPYSGWGVVDEKTFNTDRILKYIESSVLNQKDCHGNYIRELEENELCVGYPKGVKSPCVVDSGGPLMALMEPCQDSMKQKYLVGIASHDLQMCHKGLLFPVIYVDISSNVDWILEEIDYDINYYSKK